MVPVNALIQRLPSPKEKGRTIAVANLLSFVGVALPNRWRNTGCCGWGTLILPTSS